MGRGEGREGVSVGGTKEWRREGSWYRGIGWGIGGQMVKREGREGVSVEGTKEWRREVGIGE